MTSNRLEHQTNIKRYLLIASLFWAGCQLLAWGLIAISVHHTQVEHNAQRQARTIIARALGFRSWISGHGGIYVPPTEKTPPNPYLSHIPERDLTLATGKRLTLLNPAYALRDLQDEFADIFAIRTHLSSLKPLRPENAPDPWERQALESFTNEDQEFSEFTSVNGTQVLRVMQPLTTKKSCLKCHAQQGYKEGDIRGGIGITVPINDFLAEARYQKIYWAIALFFLWLFGQVGIWFSGRQITSLLTSRDKAYAELASYQNELENKVRERTLALEEANKRLEKEVGERTSIQEALEDSHSELQQIFNSAADGFRIVDWDYNMVKFNNTFAQIASASPEELSNRKCYDVFPGPFCQTDQCPLTRARNGEEIIQEVQKTRLDGSTIDLLSQTAIFYDAKGKAMGILESFRDISALKEMEKNLSDEASRNAQQAVALQQKNTDIIAKNVELEQALDELKATQSQMLQNEKMATVGQLAAGVAHEINNPTGFVTSNLSTLSKYIKRITEFLALLEEAVPASSRPEIAALRKKMKIDHINDDIHDLITESLSGTDRIKKIVMSLKNFSRQDQEDYGPADLNDCLESTLNVVWNELKYKATVTKEYGELPHTKCYAQQLNQVFMNLLVNGAQAIKDQGVITIRTWAEADSIFISISDSGSGMDEETMAHIFDPFFTTKEKNKGTGLGLSIAYDIITKKHHGKLSVTSRPGEGSTFTIELPHIED